MSELEPNLEETLLYADIVELFESNSEIVGIAINGGVLTPEKPPVMALAGYFGPDAPKDLEPKDRPPVVCLVRTKLLREEEDSIYFFIENGPLDNREDAVILVDSTGCKEMITGLPHLDTETISELRDMLRFVTWDPEGSAIKAQLFGATVEGA